MPLMATAEGRHDPTTPCGRSQQKFCQAPEQITIANHWGERIRPNFAGNYVCRLAALRFPEKVLIFDDGGTFRMAVD
jgi:hypothetical protein